VFRKTNVAKSDDLEAVVDLTVARFGGLHFAVNCAAIELEDTVLHEVPDELFDRIVAVNLRGPFLSMKHEIPAMLATEGPACIVNVASVNSFKARPRQIAYTSTKHALIGMTKAAAIEYAGLGIRINAICPGSIDTPMLRSAFERRGRDPEKAVEDLSLLGRFGRVEEIADAALWLCSEHSSYVVGHALVVDGGYLAG
jgi:NAD(P)-dependent dehydrogenase (short-subunit alcohol dehydrogenase family)